MIPYDDLVAALSSWRARQGLPVSAGSGGSGPTPQPGSGPHGSPGSGPYGSPGSGPYSAASSAPGMPEPMEEADIVDEVLADEVYDQSGGYGAYSDPEPTAIAGAPERPTDDDIDRGRDDW